MMPCDALYTTLYPPLSYTGAVAVAAAARTAAEAAAAAGSLSGGGANTGKSAGTLGGDVIGKAGGRSPFVDNHDDGLLQDDDVAPPALALMDRFHDGDQVCILLTSRYMNPCGSSFYGESGRGRSLLKYVVSGKV